MKTRFSMALLLVGGLFVASSVWATVVVRMVSAKGYIDLWLYDDPSSLGFQWADSVTNPVENFLGYVTAGSYNNTIIHRSVPGFVIQGGGFVWDDTVETVLQADNHGFTTNQFHQSNLRGTIAMAKLGGNPNSASNEWFINLANNSANLDAQNGGFTVFGEVLGDGMIDVVDQIASPPNVTDASLLPVGDTLVLQTAFATPPTTGDMHDLFGTIPLISYSSGPIVKNNLELITDISVIASAPGSVKPVQGNSGDYTIISSESPVTVSKFDFGTIVVPGPLESDIYYDNIYSTDFTEGYFDIQLASVPVAVPVTLTMTLPQGTVPNTFYRYGPTPDNHVAHWYNFMWDGQTGAIMTAGSNIIKLIFVDGQRGDDDFTQDGEIGASASAPGDDPSIGASVSTTGASGNYSTLSLQSSSDSVTKFESAANPGGAPSDVTFSEGFFDIELTNTQDTSYVVLTLPVGQQPNTYYKYGPTQDDPTYHWYEFMWDGKTGAIMGIGANSNQVALVFVDGERGDDDYTANGTIAAGVGAPGVGPATSGVGGGGGGTIDPVSLFAGLLTFFWRASARRRRS